MKFFRFNSLDIGSLLVSFLLIICLLPMPYGFYSIVRLATCIIFGIWAYTFHIRQKKELAIIAGAIVILFQPFIRIPIDRFTWNIIDLILSISLLVLIFFAKLKGDIHLIMMDCFCRL